MSLDPNKFEVPDHWEIVYEQDGGMYYFDPQSDDYYFVAEGDHTPSESSSDPEKLGIPAGAKYGAEGKASGKKVKTKSSAQLQKEKEEEEKKREESRLLNEQLAEAMAEKLFTRPEVKKHIDQKASSILNKYRPIKVKVDSSEPLTPKDMDGQMHEIFPKLLKSVPCGNVALIGPTGCGKTTIAEQVAEALGLNFYMNGAIQSEYKLTGFIDAKGQYQRTPFRDAFENGGIYLFDEIDASSANVLLQFNAALSNNVSDFPDGVVKRHENFYCIAAANTYWTGKDREYVGRNQLDAATMDRFIFIEMDYDNELEKKVSSNQEWCDYVLTVRKAVQNLKLRHIVSPRVTYMGEKMLAQKLTRSFVEESLIWKSLDVTSRKKIKGEIDKLASEEQSPVIKGQASDQVEALF